MNRKDVAIGPEVQESYYYIRGQENLEIRGTIEDYQNYRFVEICQNAKREFLETWGDLFIT